MCLTFRPQFSTHFGACVTLFVWIVQFVQETKDTSEVPQWAVCRPELHFNIYSVPAKVLQLLENPDLTVTYSLPQFLYL